MASGEAVPLVFPVENSSQLRASEEGMAVLRALGSAPVAPIVVIGPYRSGKSFLLNQLLDVPCDRGFGVGNKRSTQTRGLWIWSEERRKAGGEALNSGFGGGGQESGDDEHVAVLYVDTEGFESSRKAAYDDRVFALSTIMASVLIYNLPEAVREGDIEKLSFAAELAEEFFGRVSGDAAGGGDAGFDAPRLLWLVQRDFLQGQTVQENVESALQMLPNEENDPEVEQSNRVREALKSMASTVTAFGLRQPHLDRTRLCDIADEDLDAGYRKQRGELRRLVLELARAKRGPKGLLTGAELATLLEDTITALNKSKIPNAGSLVEAFNKDLLAYCIDDFGTEMKKARLPLDVAAFEEVAEAAKRKIHTRWERERYGSHSTASKSAASSMQALDEGMSKSLVTYEMENKLKSNEACQAASELCITKLETLQEMSLPSEHRLTSSYLECSASFNTTCVGPSKGVAWSHLDKAWNRAHSQFVTSYNRKLSGSLLMVSLLGALVSRFLLKKGAIEFLCWSLFGFLEVYPKLYLNEETLYRSKAWKVITTVWETLIFNPLVDVDHRWKPLVLWPSLLLLLAYIRIRCGQVLKRRKQRGGSARDLPTYESKRDS